nr:hypothetical protein [Candidatus Cloacimonadota bacterium]
MSDLNERIGERWHDRRKKGYNWPRLIIMLIILIAIMYGMGILQRMGNVTTEPAAEFRDSTRVENVETMP